MAQGIVTVIDSANLYIENQDYLNSSGSAGSILTVTASATGTYNGIDVTVKGERGVRFYVNFATVNATCTVRLAIQSKDLLSGLYITGATASFDGVTAGNVGTLFGFNIYPGLNAATNSNEVNANECIAPTIRLVASITATASGGSAAVSFTTGLAKLI